MIRRSFRIPSDHTTEEKQLFFQQNEKGGQSARPYSFMHPLKQNMGFLRG